MSRARVIVVGCGAVWNGAGAEDIGRDLACRTTAVATVFDAIGEVTAAGPLDPVELVLVNESAMPGPASRAAEAIRRVDPSVKVALLASGANGEVARRAPGFDAVVHLPAERDRLLRLLGRAPERAPERGPARTADAAPPRPRPVETAPARDERLGDVDLIDAVRTAPGSVRDLAVRLIVQQTGWLDLHLLESGAAPPAAASAEVKRGERTFGTIVTDRAAAAELRPWADWLARWLDLDAAFEGYRVMAFRDDLTDAWNRRFFHTFLTDTVARAREVRRPITVMVFDIDDFKRFNDQFGHEAGDVVLVETVRLLESVIRKGDRVCRIGGDEFAVIFADLEGPREAGSTHPSEAEQIAARFQDQICKMRFPKLGRDAPGPLSISAGLATFPWDGHTPQELLHWADLRALQSKQKGKNAITLGPCV